MIDDFRMSLGHHWLDVDFDRNGAFVVVDIYRHEIASVITPDSPYPVIIYREPPFYRDHPMHMIRVTPDNMWEILEKTLCTLLQIPAQHNKLLVSNPNHPLAAVMGKN